MRPLHGLIIFFTVVIISLLIIVAKLVYFSPVKNLGNNQVEQEGIFDSFKTLGSDFGDIVQDTKQGTTALREFIESLTNTNTSLQFSDQELEALRKTLIEKQAQEQAALAQIDSISEALPDQWTVSLAREEMAGSSDAKFLLNFEKINECKKILAFYDVENKDNIEKEVFETNNERLDQQCKLEIFSENENHITVDVCANDIGCENIDELRNLLNSK